MREMTARHWRCARRQYFASTPAQRDAIRSAWLAWRGPLTALYFQYLVDVETGVMQKRTECMRRRDSELRRAIAEEMARQAVLPIGCAL